MDTGKGNFVVLDELLDNMVKKDIDKATNDLDKKILLNMALNDLKDRHPEYGSLFSVGEEVSIKESKFKITYIASDRMTLTLLPKE